MPFPPCPPMEVCSSPHHHFRKLLGYLPWACRGVGPEGSSGRSGTVDWLCLGPAQQRSCIASWGCSPSARGPDLTIPPCGCHRMAMGSMLCPHEMRTGIGSVSSICHSRCSGESQSTSLPAGAHRQWILACSARPQWQHYQYFVLRWQPGIILPKRTNFFESQCRKKKVMLLHPN